MSQRFIPQKVIERQGIYNSLFTQAMDSGERAELAKRYDELSIALLREENISSFDRKMVLIAHSPLFAIYFLIGLGVLFLPYIISFLLLGFAVEEHKALFYAISLCAILWIHIVVLLFSKITGMIEKKGDICLYDEVTYACFQPVIFFFIAGFPYKTLIYFLFLAITIISQASQLNLVSILDRNWYAFFEINQYAILLLIASDRILQSASKEKGRLLAKLKLIKDSFARFNMLIPFGVLTPQQRYGVEIKDYNDFHALVTVHPDILGLRALQAAINSLNPVLFIAVPDYERQTISRFVEDTISRWSMGHYTEKMRSLLPEEMFKENYDKMKNLYKYLQRSVGDYDTLAMLLGKALLESENNLEKYYKEIIDHLDAFNK